jgi:Ca2+-binding EF-hand superfamily protein
MIGLGFAQNIEMVKDMIAVVDKGGEEGNNLIEFPEFLEFIRKGDCNESTKEMTQFFKDLTSSKLDVQ